MNVSVGETSAVLYAFAQVLTTVDTLPSDELVPRRARVQLWPVLPRHCSTA